MKAPESKATPLNDADVVKYIKLVAEAGGLELEKTRHGGNFCTVYVSAEHGLVKTDQLALLRKYKEALVEAGLPPSSVQVTRYDNPPYKNKATGKTEEGHPRHGDPLIIIDSVWWAPEVNAPEVAVSTEPSPDLGPT